MNTTTLWNVLTFQMRENYCCLVDFRKKKTHNRTKNVGTCNIETLQSLSGLIKKILNNVYSSWSFFHDICMYFVSIFPLFAIFCIFPLLFVTFTCKPVQFVYKCIVPHDLVFWVNTELKLTKPPFPPYPLECPIVKALMKQRKKTKRLIDHITQL